MPLTRRQVLSTFGVAGVALAADAAKDRGTASAQSATAGGAFALPPLPYPASALEPHIDAQTMTIHHDRHHQAYVTNLNASMANAGPIRSMSLDDILKNLPQAPDAVRTAIRNNGGGHVNHVQFWTLMKPNAGGPPTGAIADVIQATFGGLDRFKDAFAAAAAARFGSGWAWLSDDNGTLVIHSTANQDTPSMENKRAIFGLDVWEHAYYLKYQNRRADYVAAFWNVINWAEVNRRLRG